MKERSVRLLAVQCLALAGYLEAASAGPVKPEEPAPFVDPRPAAAPRPLILSRGEALNVIDEALYALAEQYALNDRLADAVAVLERVAKESPDEGARSITHYNLARIYEEKMNDPAKARAEYALVTGPWAASARGHVLMPLRRERRWAEAIAFLRESLVAATSPEDRAEAVRFITTLARESQDAALMESVLKSVPDLITYADAQAAAAARRKKIEEARRREAELRAAGMVRTPPGPPGPPTTAPRPEATDRRARLEADIRELERGGFPEEAERLREELRKLGKPDQF